MEANALNSKHAGNERTNSSGETVRTGQLRWEGDYGNVTSSFVILSVTDFGDSWVEEQVTIAVARDANVLGKNQHAWFQGKPA